MTKSELIASIAQGSGLSKADASRALQSTTEAITQILANNDSVSIVGFGTFKVGYRQARTGRNPKTGATIQIAAAKTVRFTAGKALKEAIN